MSLKSRIIWIICRDYRSKANNSSRNPGIQKRIKIFTQENPEIDTINISDKHLEEEYESDFFNSAEFYDQYKKDDKKLKKLINFKRVERKYFSPTKYPNLLTWSEKEQIRYLFNSDPSTWTPEKLALSFPATVDIIKKVLKSQWAPADSERIRKHDKAVSDNWKALENGEVILPTSFKTHIQSFISRKERTCDSGTAELLSKEVKNVANKTSCSSEFVNIIKSYKNKAITEDNSTTAVESVDKKTSYKNERNSLSSCKEVSSSKSKHYTLEELRNEVKMSFVNSATCPSDVDKHFIKGSPSSSHNMNKTMSFEMKSEVDSSIPKRHETNENKIQSNFPLETEILKIEIPKGKKKGRSTYKVKDCYYDENGDFLYKVPGMT